MYIYLLNLSALKDSKKNWSNNLGTLISHMGKILFVAYIPLYPYALLLFYNKDSFKEVIYCTYYKIISTLKNKQRKK